MDFESIEDIARSGFVGFVPVSTLQASACCEVPAEQGIYLVLRQDKTPPSFLAQNAGGHFKKRDPTVSTTELQSAWVDGTVILYIGKAGGSNGGATLKGRLRQYMRFGEGKPVGHWGGRYIWQLQDATDLLVCWKPARDEEPADAEERLIVQFKHYYGKRPFASLQG